MTTPEFGDHLRSRRDDPAFELARGETARPAVEQLDRVDASIDLLRQIIDRRIDEFVDDRAKCLRIAISHAPRLGLLATPLPRYHVGRDGPGAACKAEEGRAVGKPRADLADRVVDRIEPIGDGLEHRQRMIDQSR